LILNTVCIHNCPQQLQGQLKIHKRKKINILNGNLISASLLMIAFGMQSRLVRPIAVQ